MKQQNLRWYWNRLLAMSPQEIVDRSKKSVNQKIWSRRTSWVAPIPDLTGKQDPWELPSLQNADSESQLLLAEANRYLDGQYRLLNIEFEEPKIDWHLDPQSGTRAPLEFGLTLNYRDYALVGNVKNIWEKNRHHHLTVLALAYGLTNNDVYAQAIEQQLLDWIEANPFPLGVNWHSSLELGVRLISWIWIERLLRGTAVHQRLFGRAGKMWSAIYWHQWLIAQYYSPGSSANNHLIGEMAGLFIASSIWSVFPESTQWQSLGKKILEREVSRQTFADGLNREQAFDYHIFSLEFFLLAGIEAERTKNPVSSGYRDWVTKMLTAIPPLVDVGGNLPDYGDSDEGMALQLRPLGSSRIDWLYRLGRQWLKAPVPLPANDSGLATATIAINAKDEVDRTRELKSTAFEDAGLFVLASNRGQPEEVFCLADAGALGFLSLAAHGHADALSFTLSVGGVPIVVDPGTCTYVGDFPERAYFRSTKAHNTIVIDEVDQSEPAGTFLWRSKAETKVLSWDASPEGATLLAEHDGYTRLAQGVTHQRQLRLSEKLLEIEDRLQGAGSHIYEWRLHFSPLCTVDLQSNICLVNWTEGELKIQLDSKMEWSIVRGGAAAGWYSPGFNLKEPIFTLIGRAKMAAPVSLATRLEIN